MIKPFEMTKFFLLFAVACTATVPSALAAQNVANSRHNLSVTGPGAVRSSGPAGTNEVCVFCHTPHTAAPDGELWNRSESAVTYTPYASSTMAAAPDQPTGKSRLCLSCHDGTVALGALRNPPGRAPNDLAATRLNAGQRGFLGTDLSDDHPISFDYNAALYSNPDREIADPRSIDLPLENIGGEMHLQCTTCHDAHDNTQAPFLRRDTLGGAICTTCHVKPDWPASSHATSTAIPAGATPWPERRPEWRGASVGENGCMNCHTPHNAATPARLIKDVEEDTCYLCHNGAVAQTNVGSDFAKIGGGHPVASPTYAGLHDATKAENPATMPMHVECVDCHNPHAGAPDEPPMISFNPGNPAAPHTVAPQANALIRGVTGIDVNGNPVASVTNQYELCFKCHGRFAEGPCGGSSNTRCSTANSYSMVRHDGVYNIRDKVNSGNPALVSWHPIESNNPSNNTEVQSLKAPLNASTSLIYCTDCHNSDQSGAAGGSGPDGTHGSVYEFLLGQRYTVNGETPYSAAVYALCFKCHDSSRFNNRVSTGFDHEIHMIGGDITCISCHDPHGSQKFPHLINFLLSTTSGGNWTITSDCGGGPGSCGRPEPTWEDLGAQRGRCYLNCHGTRHDPFTY